MFISIQITSYMTVLIPDSCWKNCRPQPTSKALRTPGVRSIFNKTLEPMERITKRSNIKSKMFVLGNKDHIKEKKSSFYCDLSYDRNMVCRAAYAP